MSISIFVFQWHISFRVIQTSYFVEIFFDVLKLNIEKSHCWKEENEIAFLCWSSAKTRVESSREEIRAGEFGASDELVLTTINGSCWNLEKTRASSCSSCNYVDDKSQKPWYIHIKKEFTKDRLVVNYLICILCIPPVLEKR